MIKSVFFGVCFFVQRNVCYLRLDCFEEQKQKFHRHLASLKSFDTA